MAKKRELRPSDIYDKAAVYNDKIEPLVRSLMAACIAERMPMFVSVATKNTDEGTQYASRVVLGAAKIRLSDNRIRSYILSLRKIGKDELPPRVKEAIEVLESYSESVRAVSENSGPESVGVNLKDNLIDGFCAVSGGGDAIIV